MFFGSALTNFGVRLLLDAVVDLAPPPAPAGRRPTATVRPLDAPFSGFVFKVQANMDPSHRDRIAFVRVCSGQFERGMVVTHGPTRQAVRHQVRPQRVRPGARDDRRGLAGRRRRTRQRHRRPGRRLALARRPGHVPRRSRASRPSTSRWRGSATPDGSSSSARASPSSTRRASSRCCATATSATRRRCWPPSGPMQFEVAVHRLEHEFGAPVELSPTGYRVARRTDDGQLPTLRAMQRRRRAGALRRHAARPVREPVLAGAGRRGSSPTSCSNRWWAKA